MRASSRRQFLQTSLGGAAALTARAYTGAAEKPSDRIRMAVMGVKGRGRGLVRGFSSIPEVELVAFCEVDENVVGNGFKALHESHKREPKVEKDVRRVLEDKNLDALVIAAPDHWHALATIWGCQAGKDVYVEKPVSHNLREGRRMIEAARKYDRVVAVGTQRRSSESYRAAAEFVRSGKLGKVPYIRAMIGGGRPNIGRKPNGPVPAGVDYDLWLGPAAERPFNPNRFHYEWHWFWDYGTGELGNNGVHGLDAARLIVPGLDEPTRITSTGGKFVLDDDREAPDTQIATFDFPGTTLVWEHRMWSKDAPYHRNGWVTIFGEKGTLVFDGEAWTVRDIKDAAHKAVPYEEPHLKNFLECVKSRQRPNADIEQGHLSTRLCHLGNIAFRVGRSIQFDAATETIPGDAAASALLGRSYRKPFIVPDKV